MTIVRVVELVSANKAKAAFLAPLLLAVAAALGNWLITGNWDDTEVRLAASGAVLGAASGVATWFTPAGEARVPIRKGDRIDPLSERGLTLLETIVVLLVVGLLVLAVLVLT
jgi:prepilin-type N-terminal cleavage/methylation domain-containing protein